MGRRRPRNPVRRERQHEKYSDAVMEIYAGRCDLCRKDGADTIDHVVPVAWGGADHPSNLVPAHRSCNSRKGAAQPGREQYTQPSRWLPGYGANVPGMVWVPMFSFVRSPYVFALLVIAGMVAWAGRLVGVPVVQQVGMGVVLVVLLGMVVSVVAWWGLCVRASRLSHGRVAIEGSEWVAYELARVRSASGKDLGEAPPERE